MLSGYLQRGVVLVRACALLMACAITVPGQAATPTTTPEPLRVVVLPNTPSSLQTVQAARMIDDFAATEGRKVVWSVVARPVELFARLTTGQSDLAVGSLPPELARQPRLSPSSPVATERYVVVGRMDNPAGTPLELRNARLGLSLRTPLWDYFNALLKVVPGLKLKAQPNYAARDSALKQVADGALDVAVVAVGADPGWLRDYPTVRVLFDLTGDEPVNWYLRQSDAPLRERLDAFIERFHTAYFEPAATPPRDFAAIKRSGVLRVISRVTQPDYYIDHGKPVGFEFEMARAFADQHGLRLEVLTARDDQQMLEWLRGGVGDLITARLAVDSLPRDVSFNFSRRYHYTAYAAVSRQGLELRSPADLRGLKVAALDNSTELRALRSVRVEDNPVNLVPLTDLKSRDALLDRVATGQIDATVVTGDEAGALAASYPGLRVGPSLPHQFDYRWIARSDDPRLLAAVDDFLLAGQTNGLATMLSARYLEQGETPRALAGGSDKLSPFDPIVRRYAERYGFDWRLIAAQMYQESQFNPRATSRRGAVGLMQLLPSTAEALGFANLGRPESAIHAGVKYLSTLRNEFDAEVPVGERTWFALAAYNMGVQRVEKARELATRLSLDPNRWSGNVERAMQVLARATGRSGDSRYGQALIYVRTIRSLYGSYRDVLALIGTQGRLTPSA